MSWVQELPGALSASLSHFSSPSFPNCTSDVLVLDFLCCQHCCRAIAKPSPSPQGLGASCSAPGFLWAHGGEQGDSCSLSPSALNQRLGHFAFELLMCQELSRVRRVLQVGGTRPLPTPTCLLGSSGKAGTPLPALIFFLPAIGLEGF